MDCVVPLIPTPPVTITPFVLEVDEVELENVITPIKISISWNYFLNIYYLFEL